MPLRSISPVGTPVPLRTVLAAMRAACRNGSEQRAFTEALSTQLAGAACVPVSSGRAALTLILQTLREHADPRRNEVVVPAYTCFSVPSAIVRAGLKVVPCDVDPQHLDFDHTMLPRLVSSRTLCIVPNHLFGLPARMELPLELARAHDAYIVEDAAQSLGARLDGRPVGTLGDVGFLSLGRGKPLTAIGGGVIILPKFGDLGTRLRRRTDRLPRPPRLPWRVVVKAIGHALFLTPHRFALAERMPFVKLGESKFSPVFAIGGLSAFQAALAVAGLADQPAVSAKRRANAAVLLDALGDLPGLEAIQPVKNAEPVYVRLPIRTSRLETHDLLSRRLADRRLGVCFFMYPSAITAIPQLETHLAAGALPCPAAERVAASLLTLPTHPLVGSSDLEAIIKCLTHTDLR
jgi:dTDP-4-amino-4,6-dideoxygalactose transaminase